MIVNLAHYEKDYKNEEWQPKVYLWITQNSKTHGMNRQQDLTECPEGTD